jgi:hypothetical protein
VPRIVVGAGGAFDCKAAYTSGAEMFRKLLEMKQKFYREELNHLIIEKNHDLTLPEKDAKVRPVKHISRRRNWAVLRRDLRFFIDFCIARLIVWRESRRRKKQ